MLGIVNDSAWCYKEVAIVRDFILHESPVLEMGVERLLLLQLPIVEPEHIEFVVNMLKNNLLPSTCHTIEMVALFGLGGVVERPFQPTIVRTAVAPLITTSIIAIFIKIGYFFSGKGIFVVLIAFDLFHEISNGIIIIT